MYFLKWRWVPSPNERKSFRMQDLTNSENSEKGEKGKKGKRGKGEAYVRAVIGDLHKDFLGAIFLFLSERVPAEETHKHGEANLALYRNYVSFHRQRYSFTIAVDGHMAQIEVAADCQTFHPGFGDEAFQSGKP